MFDDRPQEQSYDFEAASAAAIHMVRRSIGGFVHTQHLIALYIPKGLLDPAGPPDVYLFNY
jgi:hypothetical protein